MAKNIYDISALIDPGMYSIVSTIPDGEWFSRKPGPATTYYLTIGNTEQSYNHHEQDNIDAVNTFDISTNGTLTVVTPDWITYNKETKMLTIDANNFTNVNGDDIAPTEREGEIKFALEEDDTITAALKIKQMFQCNILPIGNVDLSSYKQSYKGGSVLKEINLGKQTYSTNGTLIVNNKYNSQNASWVHIDSSNVKSDGRVEYTFLIDKNELDPTKEVMSEQRTGTLYLTTKEDPDPLCTTNEQSESIESDGVCLTVTQAPNYYIRTNLNGKDLSTNEYTLNISGDASEGIDASLVTNTNTVVGVKSSIDTSSSAWLSTSKDSNGASGGTIMIPLNYLINASANTGDSERTGKIIFSLPGARGDHDTLTFNIIQSILYRLSLDSTMYEKEYGVGDLQISGFDTNGTVKVQTKVDPAGALKNGGLTVSNNTATLSFYKNGNTGTELSTPKKVNVTFALNEDPTKTVDVTIIQKPQYDIWARDSKNINFDSISWNYKGATHDTPYIKTNGTVSVSTASDWIKCDTESPTEENGIRTYTIIPTTPYKISSDPTQGEGGGTRTGSITFTMNETNSGNPAITKTINCKQDPEPYILTKLRTLIYDDSYVEDNTCTVNLDTADTSTIDASLLGFTMGSYIINPSISYENNSSNDEWIKVLGQSQLGMNVGKYLYNFNNLQINVNENTSKTERSASVALTLYDEKIYKNTSGKSWNDYKFGSLTFKVVQPAPYYLEYIGIDKFPDVPANGNEVIELDKNNFITNGTLTYDASTVPDWVSKVEISENDDTGFTYEIYVKENANTETSLSTERTANIVFYLEEDKSQKVNISLTQSATPGIIALSKAINNVSTYSVDGSTFSNLGCGVTVLSNCYIYTNTSETPSISGADWVSFKTDSGESTCEIDGLKKYMLLLGRNDTELPVGHKTYYNTTYNSSNGYGKDEIYDCSNFSSERSANLAVSITSGNSTKSVNVTVEQNKSYYILTWLNNPIIGGTAAEPKITCDVSLDSSADTKFYPMLATNIDPNVYGNYYVYLESNNSSTWCSSVESKFKNFGQIYIYSPGSGEPLYFNIDANDTNSSRTGKIKLTTANKGYYNVLTFNITQPA